jgi:hypothetical protein
VVPDDIAAEKLRAGAARKAVRGTRCAKSTLAARQNKRGKRLSLRQPMFLTSRRN